MHFVGLFFVFIIENARSKKQKKKILLYFVGLFVVFKQIFNYNNNNINNNFIEVRLKLYIHWASQK